jgi:CheY-like chemotaxis protein
MNDPEARILLVEDEKTARQAIIAAFADNNWKFDEYGDVESAIKAIANGRSEGWEYDAAILDFRLPPSPTKGGTPVDESICLMVKSWTLVWHISAYFGEAEVDQHVRTCHSAGEQVAMIPKDVGWAGKLEHQIKQALATRRIRQSLAMLQPNSFDSGYSRGFRRDSSTASATSLFRQLCDDIERSWKELAPAFQGELRESFEIDVSEDGDVKSVYPK